VEAGFSDHAGREELAELVDDFTVAMAAIMATMNVEDILCGGVQGPTLFINVRLSLQTSEFPLLLLIYHECFCFSC